MSRQFVENKLFLASANKSKIVEIETLLSPYKIEVVTTANLNITEPEETGLTFEDNAKLKAKYYGEIQGMPALADDSGLSIEALGGFPGVYSARFAGENGNYAQAFELIERKLSEKGLTTSPAFFTCSLALWWPDNHFEVFEGKIPGKLSFPPAEGGFGYGPIFVPDGYSVTFAELKSEEKNKISHRALAFNKMIEACFK